jgi:hypothetical protein
MTPTERYGNPSARSARDWSSKEFDSSGDGRLPLWIAHEL